MRLKRLTLQDFDRLADGTRLKERSKQLAREVLVDGGTPTGVAARHGMTPQRVSLAVGVIEKAYFEDREGGFGWVSLDMDLPEKLALQLDELVKALKESKNESQVEQVTELLVSAVAKAKTQLG